MEPEVTVTVSTVSAAGSTGDAPAGITLASETGLIRFWHGTDLGTAEQIAEGGVNYEQMALYLAQHGGLKVAPDYFWTTMRPRIACQYARLNNAVNMNGALPAVFSFALPTTVVAELLRSVPPLGGQWSQEDADFRFLPECFATINSAMNEVTVTLEADMKLDE